MPKLSTKPNRFYPSIPGITDDQETHTNALQQIRESIETHERRNNNYRKSFVRFEELIDLGIINDSGEYILNAGGGGGGISNVVEDTTPQLGGDLESNGFNVSIAVDDSIIFSNGVGTLSITGSSVSGNLDVAVAGGFGIWDFGTVDVQVQDLVITGPLTQVGDFTAAEHRINIQTVSNGDSILGFHEVSALYGHSMRFDGGLNEFQFKRHANSAAGADVFRVPRDSARIDFDVDIFAHDYIQLRGGTRLYAYDTTNTSSTFIYQATPNFTVVGPGGINWSVSGFNYLDFLGSTKWRFRSDTGGAISEVGYTTATTIQDNLYTSTTFIDHRVSGGTVPVVRLRDGISLRIQDTTDFDYGEFSHDGTDFNLALTGTADFNITGVTAITLNAKEAFKANDTWLRLNNANHFTSGVYTPNPVRIDDWFELRDGTSVGQMRFTHNAVDMNISFSSTGSVNFLDGVEIRAYDPLDTDYISISHDGASGFIHAFNAAALSLQVNSATRAQLYPYRLAVLGDIVAATPPTTEGVVCKFEGWDVDETDKLWDVGLDGTGELLLRSYMRGGGGTGGIVNIQADNGAGAFSTVFRGLGNATNGSTSVRGGQKTELSNLAATQIWAAFANTYARMYINNQIKLSTEDNILGGVATSVQISSEANNDTTYNLLHFTWLNNTVRGRLGHLNSDWLELRNMIHGGGTIISGENVSGTGVNFFLCDPDGPSVDMSNNFLIQATVQDYALESTSPTITTGAITFNLANGNAFQVTLTANITSITLSNPPASGDYGECIIKFVQNATGGWTVGGWPASVNWPGGTAPTITGTATTGTDIVVLKTWDGGANWFGDYSQDYQ